MSTNPIGDTTQSIDGAPPSAGLLAEFAGQADLLQAVRALRERGYEKLDAFTPFPIHGMDEALGVKPTPLAWYALGAGLAGGFGALAFQWWTNAVDYPYLISGKPLFSLPANIPVAFEVVILAAAFATFFGMLMLNGLPRLSNPLFRSDRFRAATNDGFFVFVSDHDNDEQALRDVLQSLAPRHVETIASTPEERIPKGLKLTAIVLGALALLPPLAIASVRGTTSARPRLHNFFDMDFQPKFKAQTTSDLFADGRAMRPRVDGTIPRGQLQIDRAYFAGRTDVGADGEKAEWIKTAPLEVTTESLARGRERFNIHCAVCHGRAGEGNGLASVRAMELQQGTWVPPTSIHAEHVRKQPDGQLFNSITNGIRKMPAYGHQIPPKDRWAIILYLRALQRSQNATIDDVPDQVRSTLRDLD